MKIISVLAGTSGFYCTTSCDKQEKKKKINLETVAGKRKLDYKSCNPRHAINHLIQLRSVSLCASTRENKGTREGTRSSPQLSLHTHCDDLPRHDAMYRAGVVGKSFFLLSFYLVSVCCQRSASAFPSQS